ncbi:hypothetical protein PUMCH_002409 [Australozyma saopauloensis]|uniref:Sister chromatid cohesion protein n=1 Tax=Australozyma saopauloensis TaxID=291208 RepID=A0AAX4H967_9ASCO|nr:hypothetical protein PUMCH_002409 [[Candida] saopauloensis]
MFLISHVNRYVSINLVRPVSDLPHTYSKGKTERLSSRMQEKKPQLNLPDILGITPLYHLIPKQELVPLLCFSDVSVPNPDLTQYLPQASQPLLLRVLDCLDSNENDEISACSDLLLEIGAYEHTDVSNVVFRRPVMATQTKREVVPNISKLELETLQATSRIKFEDLVLRDQQVQLELDDAEDMRDIPKRTNKEAFREHVRNFDTKFRKLNPTNTGKAPKSVRRERLPPRNTSLSFPQLKDARVASILAIVDQVINDEGSMNASDQVPDNAEIKLLHPADMETISKNLDALYNSAEFRDLSIDMLLKVQILCMRDLSQPGNINQRSMDDLSASLMACSILLRTLNSQLDDRRLYMDSRLGEAINFLSKLVFEIFRSKRCALLIPQTVETMNFLAPLLKLNLGNDQVLGSVETFILSLIFEDTCYNGLDDLRNCIILLLVQIYTSAPSHRSYIINELLMKFKDNSQGRAISSAFRLSNGSSILVFAALLVKLIESQDLTQLKKKLDLFSGQIKTLGEEHHISQKRLGLIDTIISSGEDVQFVTNQLVDFVLQFLALNDSSIKDRFATLLQELLEMAFLPEYPGAPIIISAISQRLLEDFRNGVFAAGIEPFVLEIVSKCAIVVLKMKMNASEVPNCEGSIDTNILAAASKLHKSNLLSCQRVYSDKFEYRVQSSLIYFAKLFNTLQRHRTFSIFYQIDVDSESSKLDHVSTRNLDILDEFLDMLVNGHTLRFLKGYAQDDENTQKLYDQMLLSTYYISIYDHFLETLCMSLESHRAKLASKAIRVLSLLIDLDPKLLLISSIKISISNLLQEGSPLSRDAVIELIGNYMFTGSELLEKYYLLIGSRIHDDSKLIRKRVIRLMKRLYSESTTSELKVYSSLKLIRCLDDREMSVVNLAINSITCLWFKETSNEKLQIILSEVVLKDSRLCRLFQDFIRTILTGKDQGEYVSDIKSIIGFTFNSIVNDIESESLTSLISHLNLAIAFAEVDGNLISQADLLTVSPYIVLPESLVGGSALLILKLLRIVLPTCRVLRPDFVTTTQTALLQNLTKFSSLELFEAISVVHELCKVQNDFTRELKASISSMKLLYSMTDAGYALTKPAESRKFVRLINLIGAFVSTCSFDNSRPLFQKHKVLLPGARDVSSSFVELFLMIYHNNVNLEIRIACIDNVLRIANTHPVMYSNQNLLKTVDSIFSGAQNDIKLIVVECLMSFLHKEDENAKLRAGFKSTSSKSINFNGASFDDVVPRSVNDEICSNVAQKYLPAVLNICISQPNAESPVLFMQLALKLGLANPKVCISTIIALEASHNKKIRGIATSLHVDLFQKHESLADSNYLEAFRLAISYVKAFTNGQIDQAPHFLRNVYRVVSSAYISRKKLVLTLMRVFESGFSAQTLADACSKRDEIIFLALNLLAVNYTCLEEVCIILHTLDRVILSDGYDLSDRVTDAMGLHQKGGMMIENLQIIFVQCQSILALIQLRFVLATTYNIRPMVMREFRPNKPNLDLRQQTRIYKQIDFSVKELGLKTNLSVPAKFGPIYSKVVHAIADHVI